MVCFVLEEIQGHLLFSRMSCLINEEFEHQKQRSLDLWKNELFMLNVIRTYQVVIQNSLFIHFNGRIGEFLWLNDTYITFTKYISKEERWLNNKMFVILSKIKIKKSHISWAKIGPYLTWSFYILNQ